jgi:hypothetical protein
MGIQINGQTDIISATDGNLTVSGANLPTVTNLNATGIVTATGFVGNISGNLSGNINSIGVSTTTTLRSNNIGVNTNSTQTAEVYIAGVGKTEGLILSNRNPGKFTPLILENYGSAGAAGDSLLNRAPFIKARRYTIPLFGNQSYDGSSFSVDLAVGQGLFNLVAGTVLDTDTQLYKYEGARGASRLSLLDGDVRIYTSNVSVGTTGATVNWNQIYPPPIFRARQTTTQTINNSVTTKLTYTTEDFDTAGFYDPSTSRFQPTIPGYYQLTATIRLPGVINNHRLDLAFYVNGVENIATGGNQQGANDSGMSITALVFLNGLQYVEVYVNQNSGGDRSTGNGSNTGGTNTIMHFSGQLVHPTIPPAA